MLTISGHSHRQTLFETALLAPVPVDPHNGTSFILQALFVLDVLLDAASKETLWTMQIT